MDNLGQIIIYKNNVEVKLYSNNVWLNQEQLTKLYNTTISTISYHIKNIIEEGELEEHQVIRNFKDINGNGRTYNIKYYNLDMIIAIGFRVKSNVGTEFRKWAIERLNEYIIKGFTLNDDLLKRAGGGKYFEELLARIRDIKSSEKIFWRKVLDIFATSVDYDPKSLIAKEFFKTVQNKMHWASHGHTAAEIIVSRADANKDFMGLTNFSGEYPTLMEASIAKNYLTEEELDILNRIVSAYLDVAEIRAMDEEVMTMSDWVSELDDFLKMSRKDILEGGGKVSHKDALEHVKREYTKYKDRVLLEPTEVELHYLESINELKEIE